MTKVLFASFLLLSFTYLLAQGRPGCWLKTDFGKWKIQMTDSVFMEWFDILKDTAEKSILMMYGSPMSEYGVFLNANLDKYPDYFQYTESGLGNNSFLFIGNENGFNQPLLIPGNIISLSNFNGHDFIQMRIRGHGCCNSNRSWWLDLALLKTSEGFVFDTIGAVYSEKYWYENTGRYYRYAGKSFVTASDSVPLLLMPGQIDREDAPYSNNSIAFLPSSVRGSVLYEEVFENEAYSYVRITVTDKVISASQYLDYLRPGDYLEAFIKKVISLL